MLVLDQPTKKGTGLSPFRVMKHACMHLLFCYRGRNDKYGFSLSLHPHRHMMNLLREVLSYVFFEVQIWKMADNASVSKFQHLCKRKSCTYF